jgi:hypothetical protein
MVPKKYDVEFQLDNATLSDNSWSNLGYPSAIEKLFFSNNDITESVVYFDPEKPYFEFEISANRD